MHYQIQVATDPQFQNIVINKVVPVITDYQITSGLEYFTTYWWRVKTINALTGAQSEWSVPCAFKVKAKDVEISHNVDNSYIIYGSEYYGLEHKFVTSYDTECIIPDAIIGTGLCLPTSGVAQIGSICCDDPSIKYCVGVCTSEWTEDVEYILTEDNFVILTEDGQGLLLEFGF